MSTPTERNSLQWCLHWAEVSRVLRIRYNRDRVDSCAARYGLRTREVMEAAREMLGKLPEEELIHPRAIKNAIETGALLAKARRGR